MRRKASIWQRGASGLWYCTHNGEQVKLSLDRKEKAFHTRKGDDAQPAAGYHLTL